jgi:hypothetical protein
VFIYNDPRRRARTNDTPIPVPTPTRTSATINATGEPLLGLRVGALATPERSTIGGFCCSTVVDVACVLRFDFFESADDDFLSVRARLVVGVVGVWPVGVIAISPPRLGLIASGVLAPGLDAVVVGVGPARVVVGGLGSAASFGATPGSARAPNA